jgi:lipopolysaccharide export LptBFGC system permease protein LptF
MTRLLDRYILGELLRVIGLTTAVLVTVIAFGATIKPLAGNNLLDAAQTAKYLALAIVPMLQFALPFAAGFGATLTLHRMASDNEIQAMAVGGINYRRVLLPVAGLGLALFLVMVLLTQWIIPQFWTAIEQMLATDITKVFAASIRRGEAFEFGRLQVYAHDIIPQSEPEGPQGPQTRLILVNVAAATLDDDGRIVADVTASQAAADVYRRDGRTIIKLVMKDSMGFSPESGLAELERAEHTIVIPGPMRDNQKTMTQGQLLATMRDPDDFAQVVEARLGLIEAIATAEARKAVDALLRAQGRVELIAEADGPQGPKHRYIISAERMHDDELVARSGGRVEILEVDGDVPVRRFTTASAKLARPAGKGIDSASVFDLVLGKYEVVDLKREGTNTRVGLTIPNVAPLGYQSSNFQELPSQALYQRGDLVQKGDERVQEGIRRLHDEIVEVQFEATSHLLQRYALSVTALLLLVLGAVLAIWLRHTLPLTVYFWAFVPAVLDLILISAGHQLLRDGRLSGHLVMWSGSALIVGVLAMAYFKLARH